MTSPPDRSEELDRLAQEFIDRARRGESPSIEEVAARHPDLADDIYELFPVLAVVEGLKDAPAHRASRAETGTGAPVRPAGDLPERIGGYRVARLLGRGGMGVVYEGVAEGDDADRVAIKVVHAHLVQEASYVARFLNEAESGRRVVHPNVVRTLATGLLDVGGDEIPYIVLEHVEGQNLRALLGEVTVVPERLCRHIARHVGSALAAVHDAGLVHRDVKPENVVITQDETIKLMDLGIAVLQDEAHRLSRTGEFVGSLLYAAPEQLAGADPDPRWDLYGLGVLLYELSTGRHPARALGRGWVDPRVHARQSAAPRETNAEVSPFFDAVVRTLLAPEAEDRFRSASELCEVLDRGERSEWWRGRKRAAAPHVHQLRGLDRPTPFFGRSAEMAALDDQLEQSRGGNGHVTLVVGDAGIGKTRLLHEWLSARHESPVALRALVIPHDPGAVGSEEYEFATALLEVLGSDDLERRLRDLLGSRAHVAGAFARHLRGEDATGDAPRLQAPLLEAAYAHAIRGLAAEGPIVLAFEDLHFASDDARTRFARFARYFHRDPVFLVGTLRSTAMSEVGASLEGLSHVTRMDLDGLDTGASLDLLREATRECPHLDDDLTQLVERTDRNPFLLLEFARECMRRQPEADADAKLDTGIPASIRGFLTARVEALEPADVELLEAASCCGYEFDPVVVADATHTGRIATLKRFGHLEHTGGLLRSAGRRYRFQHHLLQEVLYAQIHPALREAYHAALGEALEDMRGDVPEGPLALALCRHFVEGQLAVRARPHVRRALEYIVWEAHDYAATAALAEQVLTTPGLVEGEDRAFTLCLHGEQLLMQGQVQAAREPLEEALQLVDGDRSPVLAADVYLALARTHRGLAELDAMRDVYLRAVERAQQAGDGGRVSMAYGGLGNDLTYMGRLDEAEEMIRLGFRAIAGQDNPAREARLFSYLAALNLQRGELQDAERHLRRSRELAHGVGDLATEHGSLEDLGQLAFLEGRYTDALDLAGRGLDLQRQISMRQTEADALANIAFCLSELGRLDEARDTVAEAVELAERGDVVKQRAHVRMRRGNVRLLRGDLEGAEADLRFALAGAIEVRRPALYVGAASGLAETLALLGRQEEASQVQAEAEAALASTSLGRLQVRVRALRAHLLASRGAHADAALVYGECARDDAVGRSHRIPLVLPLAACRILSGEPGDAEGFLREALEWSRHSGAVRFHVLGHAWLANLDEGDVLAARVALEKHAAELPAAGRIEAYYALWRATDDEALGRAAWTEVEKLRARAPADDRDSLVEQVDRHRRIAEAFG